RESTIPAICSTPPRTFGLRESFVAYGWVENPRRQARIIIGPANFRVQFRYWANSRPNHAAPRPFDGRALGRSGPRCGSRDSALNPTGRSTHSRRVYRVLLVFSKHHGSEQSDARHGHLLWRVSALQGLAQPNTAWMRPGGATLRDEYLHQHMELYTDHSGHLQCPARSVRQHWNEANGNSDSHRPKRWWQ